jgi:hypothetical protein
MTQQKATELGLELLKGSALFTETKSIVESSLPYILQKYYQAGYEVIEVPRPGLKLGDTISEADVKRMVREGVAY